MTWHTKFFRTRNLTFALLRQRGIPMDRDGGCTIRFDDRALSGQNLFGYSAYTDGRITLCRAHLAGSAADAQQALVHELTHYWCDRFPRAMQWGHAFRVPSVYWWLSPPPDLEYCFKTTLHGWLYDADDDAFLGTYSQTTPEECVAEFMADLVVHDPDLRGVASAAARRRYQACRKMLRDLRKAYRAIRT